MGRHALGQPVPRSEDARLLTGGARFLDDVDPPGVLHAVVIRSPHAHASINAIDAGKALAMEGVQAVLTGADWQVDGLGMLPCQDSCRRRDGSAMAAPPRPALPFDRVRFVGEPVALVVAGSEARARAAADAVFADYDPRPAVLRPGQGPPVHDGFSDNEAFFARAGDEQAVEAAFACATHVIGQSLHDQRVSANTLEPRGCIGEYEPGSGRFTLRAGVHSPHILRGQLARDVFRLPEERFRVLTGDVGGSFGMRGAIYPELALVLWAARRLGRPVKWMATRSEGLTGDDHGRDVESHAALALDEDGRFLALRVSVIANMGAYLAVKGPRSSFNTLDLLSGPYRFPAMDISVSGVFTHTNPISPYRGAGGPEAALVLERLIDKAARETGFDRIALRRRNLIGADSMPYDTGLGLTYDSGDFPAVMERALSAADLRGFAARRVRSATHGILRGIGVCYAVEQTARPGVEGASVTVGEGGRVTLRIGTAGQGQGHETLWTQLLCGALGVSPGDVAVFEGDSDGTEAGGGTFNSRSAVSGGMALTGAAERIVEAGREIAAGVMEAAPADIAFADGCFAILGTDRSVTLAEVAERAGGLSANATWSPAAPTFPNGCHVCEVEIDPETGTARVVSYVAVDDVGTVLNPLLLEGQMQGGIAQGIGQALMEHLVFDPETGQNLTGSFMDYAMPRADDLCRIETESHPVPTRRNALGAKGAGEAGTVGALPAAICAVCDALDTDEIDMPATPERVWRVLTRRPPTAR